MNRRGFLGMLAGVAAVLPMARLNAQPQKLGEHPFNNNGASSGVCKDCGDAVTVHRTVVLRDHTIITLIQKGL